MANRNWQDRVAALETRVDAIEGAVGAEPAALTMTVQERLQDLGHMIEKLENSVGETPQFVETKLISVQEIFEDLATAIRLKYEEVMNEMVILKKVVSVVADKPNEGKNSSSSFRIRVPDPTPFDGERNAKDLENFLWDMENYFRAAHVPEEEMVQVTSMYLTGDAKVWWRMRTGEDAEIGHDKIDSWDKLKRELKVQFLPCNVSWLARNALRELKHDGTVRDYVKDFSSLLLDIKDMSDEDKLFNFIAGLQPWAQTELRRQGVKDVQSAMAGADRLMDFRSGGGLDFEKASKRAGSGKDKSDDSRVKTVERTTQSEVSSTSSVGNRAHKTGCYLCCGDHRMKDCPKRAKLNAIMLEENNDEGEEMTGKMNAMYLNALQILGPNEKDGEAKPGLAPCKSGF